MTSEAVLRKEHSLPQTMTCASGTTIEQGAILKLATSNTASLANGDGDYVAGICQTEVDGSDTGATSVSVYTDGLFDIYCSGSITAGQAIATSASTTGSNICVAATSTAIGSKTLGIAREDHSGSASQILVELKPGCNNNAYA